MIMYASRTGTKRNLAELRRLGWRLMVSATGVWNPHGFRYALDNGAWTAYQQGTPWDADAFTRLCYRLGPTADWIVLPDIVAGGSDSLALSLEWLRRLAWLDAPKLIAVQDGMVTEDVREHLGENVGLFLGGSTEWKLDTMDAWGALSREVGCYYHVGRVNTARRVKACVGAGADSCDGTSASMFSVNTEKLTLAGDQMGLLELMNFTHSERRRS